MIFQIIGILICLALGAWTIAASIVICFASLGFSGRLPRGYDGVVALFYMIFGCIMMCLVFSSIDINISIS